MKVLKYGVLVLVVLIAMTSMAAAEHDFTGTLDTSVSGSLYPVFVQDTPVKDQVGADSDRSSYMVFQWMDPDLDVRRAGVILVTTEIGGTGDEVRYFEDSYWNTNEAGLWTVSSTELNVRNLRAILNPGNAGSVGTYSSGNFVISESTPEFFLGSFISLLIVGILYLAMRRNMAGSFNVN